MVEVGLWGCHERTATNGGGASAGETVLIDSEEPPSRRSKSLVDPLLDFSPSRSSLFIPASASAFYERVLAISVTCAPPFPSPFQTSSTAIIPFAPKPSSSWPFYFHPSYPSLSLSLPLSLSLSLSSSSSSVPNRSVYGLAIGAKYPPPCVSKYLGRPGSMFTRD